MATDTDLYKWHEGACYAITYDPSLSELAGAVEGYADLLARLQDKDGYLGTRLSPAQPFDEKVWHDLYFTGHFIEVAVAHYRVTGKRTLLDAACRLADFYDRAREGGHPYFLDVGSRDHPESRYFDAIETILYNHFLGAVSADHFGNFYDNPLRRAGDMTGRTDRGGNPVRRTVLPNLHCTSCCFPNAWRFFGQLPEYVFSANRDGVFVNLFTDAGVRHRLSDGTAVRIEMETRYPQDGSVTVRVIPDKPTRFSLVLRVPGWCDTAKVAVAGGPWTNAKPGSYHQIDRTWKAGDQVVLDMPMRPVPIFGHSKAAAIRWQVTFAAGRSCIAWRNRMPLGWTPHERWPCWVATIRRRRSAPNSLRTRLLRAEGSRFPAVGSGIRLGGRPAQS